MSCFGELAVIKLRIEPALLQQLLVAALLYNVPVPHHQDYIRVPDGGKPMGYNKAGAALHHLLEGPLDVKGLEMGPLDTAFCAGDNRGGGLV